MIIDGDPLPFVRPCAMGGSVIEAYGQSIWVEQENPKVRFINGHIYMGIREYSKDHWHTTFRSIYYFIKGERKS